MDTQKFVGLLVFGVIGVLMVVALTPMITSVTDPNATFDNTSYGYYQMKEIETGDVWTYSNGTWTYNGDIVATNTEGDKVSTIATNNTAIRQDGLVRSTIYNGAIAETVESIVVDDADYLEINTTNVEYTDGYGVTSNGDYILKKYTTSAFVKGDTPLWVTGFTNLVANEGNSQVIVHIEGTIDDGLTINVTPKRYGTASDITVGDYTLNYEVASQGVDLYKLTSVTFDVTGTYNGEETTTTFTYSTFVLPKEITAEKSVHADTTLASVLNLIPVVAVVGLLMIFVAEFLYSRYL